MIKRIPWTKEQIDIAFEMRARGKSYGQIAIAVGHNRNSVAGIFYRHSSDIDNLHRSVISSDIPLTDKEIDTLHLLSIGKTLTEISMIDGISRAGVERRLDRVSQKTGMIGRTANVAHALRQGWIV